MAQDNEWLQRRIRDIADFPEPGVSFKDITPLLADASAFERCVDELACHFAGRPVDKVLGIEARGFIIAAPVALRLHAGFVPVRKAGKLPWRVERESYQLEYGRNVLEVHRDALAPGDRAVVIDDVLATGGTAAATASLVRRLGAEVVGLGCVLELAFLGGREKLGDLEVVTLLAYSAAITG